MRPLPALALCASLLLGACQNPDGSLNVPGTLALGAGAVLAGVAIASADDRPRHRHRDWYGHPGRGHGHWRGHGGYGHGPGWGRGWHARDHGHHRPRGDHWRW